MSGMKQEVKKFLKRFPFEKSFHLACLNCRKKIFLGCDRDSLTKFMDQHEGHKVVINDNTGIDIDEFEDATSAQDRENFAKWCVADERRNHKS